MDSVVSAALEEICAHSAAGIALAELWPGLRRPLSAAGLPLCPAVKKAVWARLLALPVLRFEAQGSSLDSGDPFIQSLEEAEGRRLRVIAKDSTRDSFLGIYDLKSAAGEISSIQRSTLERVAAARNDGITQNDLAKEFNIKGNNFFYIVKNLESQQLISRQSTIVRAKELGSQGEDALSSTSIINTNLLYLNRYARNLNLSSQQRIEIIRPDSFESTGDADGRCLHKDRCGAKDDVSVKNFLPAMKAICDKLDGADGKVLVVSDIKMALGYRWTHGHRAWRNILNRLKDANLVEEFQAKIDEKVVSCLRLLRKFDPSDLQPNIVMSGNNNLDPGHLLMHGESQTVDLFMELPIEHRLYDIVDAEGPKGITITEVAKRTGFNARKLYNRMNTMRKRFSMHWQAEMKDRTPQYRVWTSRNFLHYKAGTSLEKSEAVDKYISSGSSPNVHLGDSISSNKISCLEQRESESAGLEHTGNYSGCAMDTLSVQHSIEVPTLTEDIGRTHADKPCNAEIIPKQAAPEPCISLSISYTESQLKSGQRYPCTPTISANTREQRVLEKLKQEKFILVVELYKWLEGLEKKHTTMDRKTLTRTLNKLQQQGMCKFIKVSMPVLTNYSRKRTTEVILHPSVDALSSELLDQIHTRQRHFDIESRGGGLSRTTNDQPLTILTGVKRSLNCVDDKPVILEAMRANGFVTAKMVRAKLLHKFLCNYLSSLPEWHSAFVADNHEYGVKDPKQMCLLFPLEKAIKEMSLELFVQVVGSAKKIDGMVDKCKLGLRLSELPDQEYKCLMDTYAYGRLSRVIDILVRLKLIRLMRGKSTEDRSTSPDAVLTHAMELQPYIEEPLPRTIPSSHIKADFRPRFRHDFVFSNLDAIDAYWETLEYCYATPGYTDASHAFPGSSVPEVFHPRGWASIRVMTTEQRMELLKRVMNIDEEQKISFKDCVRIARELNLSVEQVLRVSYDRRQPRLRGDHGNLAPTTDLLVHSSIDSSVTHCRKRRSSEGRTLKHTRENSEPSEPNKMELPSQSAIEEEEKGTRPPTSPPNEDHCNHLPISKHGGHASGEKQSTMSEEDNARHALIGQCVLLRRKAMRRKRFSWTDESDRQLVMQYARQRATLGARFSRVDWNSLCNLPALPVKCGKRMALLNSNVNIRRAVMRLCNLLGKRYAVYLDTAKRIKENNSLHQSTESIYDNRFESSFKQCSWDDFEDPEIKKAVDEVLQYKRTAKLEYAKGFGSKHGKRWFDNPQADEVNSCTQESVTQVEHNKTKALRGKIYKNASGLPTTSQNKPSRCSHENILKILNGREEIIKRKVRDSLSAANAVELLKLVLLSTAAAPEVQTTLVATLQMYSESDIFMAFTYLKEKNFMVAGKGTRPFVLSRKFMYDASYSPFPFGSGKEATEFSTWLSKQERDLAEDGVSLYSDLSCGEIIHLFSLIYLGELVLTPCLPKEGVGDPDDTQNLKPSLEQLDEFEFNIPKRKSDNVEQNDMTSKRRKTQAKIDTDFCSRREKGFPGIAVVLNRETILTEDVLQCLRDEDLTSSSGMNRLGINLASLPSNLNSFQCFESDIQSAVPSGEWPWDAMARYIAHLSSASDGPNDALSSDLFRHMYSIISHAGEQGLSMQEISEAMNLQGTQSAKLIIDTLDSFQLVNKVNGYDAVRVVDRSYKPKYFLNAHTDSHSGDIYMKTQASGCGASRVTTSNLQETTMSLSDGHKVTILDSPCDPAQFHIGGQNVEGVAIGDRMQTAASPVLCNRVSSACPTSMPQPLFPWLNGDGSMNATVYKGLTRRILGYVMQKPGIMEEDIIGRMDVLNPQSCRRLLEMLVLDNHLTERMLYQTTPAPPAILQSILPSSKPAATCRRHFFANPKSTPLL